LAVRSEEACGDEEEDEEAGEQKTDGEEESVPRMINRQAGLFGGGFEKAFERQR
jgi:hypothetical protein